MSVGKLLLLMEGGWVGEMGYVFLLRLSVFLQLLHHVKFILSQHFKVRFIDDLRIDIRISSSARSA